MSYDHPFTKSILIQVPAAKVWPVLTDPKWVKTWLADTPMEFTTDWIVGNPIVIRGDLHGVYFENRGTVLQFEPEKALSYNYWNNISRLPDMPENYSTIVFNLTAMETGTQLTVTVKDLVSEIAYKHIEFYWNVTLELLKKAAEDMK